MLRNATVAVRPVHLFMTTLWARPYLFFTSLAEAAWKDGEVYRNALLAST